MQKPQRAVRSRRASLWWRTVYSKEPSTHSNHRLRTKKREEKKQAVSSYHPLLPSPSLWECLFFFPSFWKCFEPLEFYRRVKACELPKAPKLTFDTVLYTFTNKPNRCYWSSRSSSETKIIALSQPQDNPNPLTILPVSQLHWCPPQPSLGRFDYGGGCQGWGGLTFEWKSSHSPLSLSFVLTHPVGRSGPAGCDDGINSVPPTIFTVMISRSFSLHHVTPTVTSQLKTIAFNSGFWSFLSSSSLGKTFVF